MRHQYIKERRIFRVTNEFVSRNSNERSTEYRQDFTRDRDRILYSTGFRRLSGKTQVFLPLSHDHVRTRLTHTLEVSQISRVTAINLGLNPILSEAIALGHDIGHTPFGHVGERTLNLIMNKCLNFGESQDSLSDSDMGFKHNLQSLRACCDLTVMYPDVSGMNLTNFTLWGIANHSSIDWDGCPYYSKRKCKMHLQTNDCPNKGFFCLDFYNKYMEYQELPGGGDAWSFEGAIVALCDEIAQRHHDVEDAIFMGLLEKRDLVDEMGIIFKELLRDEDNLRNFTYFKQRREKYFLPLASRFLVHMYNKDLIDTTVVNLHKLARVYGIKKKADFKNVYTKIKDEDYMSVVSFSKEMKVADDRFKSFLKSTILNSFPVERMDGKGAYVIKKLFKAYLTNPNQLHDQTIVSIFNLYDGKDRKHVDVTRREIGEMRKKISSIHFKGEDKFQVVLLRCVCDHISGMTDKFVLSEFEKLYGAQESERVHIT